MRRDRRKKMLNTLAILLLLSTFAICVFINGTYFTDWIKQNANYQYVQDQMVLSVQLADDNKFEELQVKAQVLKGNRTKTETYWLNSLLWTSILMVASSIVFLTYWMTYGKGEKRRQFSRAEDFPFNYEEAAEDQDRPGVQ